jgi:predicted outer membrane repeat protein
MALFSWLQNRPSTRSTRGRAPHHHAAPRFRPRLETLEDRWLPSTLTVTSAADSGPNSLRAELAAANPGDVIDFAPSLGGQTITLTSGELAITKGLTIQGPGAGQLTVSGNNTSRIFEVNSTQPVVLSGLTLSNGNGGTSGGGCIYNHTTLTVSGCTLSGNVAHAGGAIFNLRTLTVRGCTLSGNTTDTNGRGGGIYNLGTLIVSISTLVGNRAADGGGGITNAGTATLTRCTLSNNSAGGSGGITSGGTITLTSCTFSNNSGQYAGSVWATHGTATLTNCTFSNNSTPLYGGALYVSYAAAATLTNCTFSLNSAHQGGGIYVYSGLYGQGILNLTNTIVAGNTASTGPDIFGAVATADHNLVGDATGSSGIVNGSGGNIVGGNGNPVIDARLGPLQNNGGPTQTMALLADSPAIGHADNSKAPARDQRGLKRLDEAGELTDIGAFEL